MVGQPPNPTPPTTAAEARTQLLAATEQALEAYLQAVAPQGMAPRARALIYARIWIEQMFATRWQELAGPHFPGA